MAGSIERVLSPEEQELQRYLDEIDHLKSQVATQIADLESYKAELARFSAEYHAVLGPLFAELDRLELEIAAYRRKIELLQSSPEKTVEEIDEVVENEFWAQHERIHQEEEENRAYERTWDIEKQRPELAENDAAEIKRVYRELAKKHHPDFAVDDVDRSERENAMKKVNRAFAARDLTLLKNLRDELFDHLTAFERMSVGDKLVWAIREVSRLNGKYSEALENRKTLEQGDGAELLRQHQSGLNPVAKVQQTLRDQVNDLKGELRSIIDKHKTMLGGL